MARVLFNDVVLAESSDTQVVEGNHYFPPSAVNMAYLRDSANHTSTVCAWKGRAQYYDIVVNGETVADAAWYYPDASRAASQFEGYIAFYPRKVTIEG